MATAGSDWMSVTDAMAELGVERPAVYRMIDHGQLPAYRFGRVIRLRRDDVAGTCRLLLSA